VGATPPAWARRTADVLLGLTAAGLTLSTSGMQLGAGGLAALSALGWVRGWGVVRRTPLDGPLALFFGALLLSTLASGAPLEAAGWARPWVVIAYFGVYWWVRDRAHAVRVVRIAVGAAAVTAAYGIVQHYTGLDWYRRLLGRATQVKPREAGSSGFAVVGFFRNYLTFAHTMVFPLGWAAGLALRGRALGLVATPLVVIAIVFSSARGAWLAVLAVAAAFGVLEGGRRAALPLAAVALAGALAFAAVPDFRHLATGMFSTGGSNQGRVAIYQANLDIVHDHPVLGLGFGRYRTAATPYYDAHPAADRRSHAHSNYLQIAAEAGLVGLAAFLLLWAAALGAGWGAVRATAGSEAWTVAAGGSAGLVGFLVGGLTQYSFGDNEVALTMWVTLALLVRAREP
jgi:putative inorganic carbon (hco3(-)) transporter